MEIFALGGCFAGFFHDVISLKIRLFFILPESGWENILERI